MNMSRQLAARESAGAGQAAAGGTRSLTAGDTMGNRRRMRRQWWCKTGETGGTGDGGGGQKRCKTYPFDAIVTIGTFGGEEELRAA